MNVQRITLRMVFGSLLLGWCGAGMALGDGCYFVQYKPTLADFDSHNSMIAMNRQRNQRLSACFSDPWQCR